MKNKHSLAVALAATLTGSFMAQQALAQDGLESDSDKVSYSLGMMIGDRILRQYDEVNYELLMEAMKAQKDGSDTKLTMEEAQMALQAQQEQAASVAAEANASVGMKFLEENKAKEGVSVTDSGLQYEVMEEADGPKPSVDDTVSVHYTGTLIDGTVFDSSVERGEPASFPLKGVIPGWTEGLQLMNVGSKFRFVIPSDLAYGDRGAGEAIGPGETLVFDVELLEIK